MEQALKLTPRPGAGYWPVIAAAALWASLGPMTRALIQTYHLPALSIAFLRTAGASLALLAWLAASRRDLLRLPARGLAVLLPLGLLGVGAFYAALAISVDLAGVALASVLLYTAPAWVTLGGALFLGEPLTPRKLVALALCTLGAALVARVYDPAYVRLSLPGLLAGLCAGLGYAAYSMFTKLALARMDTRTMLFYAYGLGALALLPLQDGRLAAALQPGTWPLVVAAIAGPTLGAWALFSLALRQVPASNATIVASVEPVIANLLAFALFGELLAAPQMAGGALILAAVAILQLPAPAGPRSQVGSPQA